MKANNQAAKPMSALKLYYDYRVKKLSLEQEKARLDSLKIFMATYEGTLTNAGRGATFNRAKRYKKTSKAFKILLHGGFISALASIAFTPTSTSKAVELWKAISFTVELLGFVGHIGFDIAYNSLKEKLSRVVDVKEMEALQEKIDASEYKIDRLTSELDKMLAKQIVIEPSQYTSGLQDADYNLQMFKKYLPTLTIEELQENLGLDLLVSQESFQKIVDGSLVLAPTGEIFDKDNPALKQQQDYDVLWGF